VRVVVVSKALVVGTYQRKMEELARCPGVELACIVPPCWHDHGRPIPLERVHTRGYELIVEPIRFSGRFHLFHFPGLRRRLQALRPEVVHIDEEPYNLATFLAARDARDVGARSLFFTWQNLHRRYPPPFRWMEQAVFRWCQWAIAGNKEAAEVLRRKGFRHPISVIPQFGVDPDVFAETPPPAAPPYVVGYVGRLVEEKGLLVLLDAVAPIEEEWRLEIVGGGPLAPLIERRATALGVGDRVRLRPAVPSVEVPRLLASFHLLVLPSLTRPNWKEQFGRVLIEAMSVGRPVIGSDCGEIPSVVGDAGLVVPEGDREALREALRRLMRDAELRDALAKRGRARVLTHFTHARIAQETARTYQRLLAL